ncbi:T9SS type A sorting domain-containing protein [Bacteroidota bacterium]
MSEINNFIIAFSIGRSYFTLSANINTQKNQIAITLWIEGKDSEQNFLKLRDQHEDESKDVIGSDIVWDEMHYKIDRVWENNSEISEENMIVNFRVLYNSSYVYFDEKQKLKYQDHSDVIHEVEMEDTIPITCFSVSEWFFLVYGVQLEPLPIYYFLIFGTDKHGIYFYRDHNSYNPEQFSNEFYGVTITDIETNSLMNPDLYLVGTKEGEIHYGIIPWEPGDVKLITKNLLNIEVIPHPVGLEAMLNFTLPNNSILSIKLYNTLGIELKTIADEYFNEGENTVPIDVSDLLSGVFLIAIQYEGITVVEKIVISK